MSAAGLLLFCADECTCEHAPSQHDDGFGCTALGALGPCDCLAGWTFGDDSDGEW